MKQRTSAIFALTAALLVASTTVSAQWKVASDKTVGGFKWAESVAYDAKRKVLYAGAFGTKLDPGLKDNGGWISKLSLEGKILDEKFLPAKGGEPLSKPKGIWVQGDRLWVTDIDSVWIFDLNTKKGRKLPLPGVVFANDPAVLGKALYVSDNRADQLFKVEPADFLNVKGEPKVAVVFKGAGIHPNGVYPTRDGMLLMGGFLAADKPKAIYALGVSGQLKTLSDPIGRLDGLYEMPDGSILATDWNTGSLFVWSEKAGMQKLATGFKGPADFTVFARKGGLTVVVPDLVQSHLRIIQLSK